MTAEPSHPDTHEYSTDVLVPNRIEKNSAVVIARSRRSIGAKTQNTGVTRTQTSCHQTPAIPARQTPDITVDVESVAVPDPNMKNTS